MKRLVDFLKTDIWRVRLKNLPKRRSFLIKQARILLVALRDFNEDKCQLRASALTFYSLLSVVPVVAMAFGIAKGFGFEKLLEKQLMSRFAGQEEVLAQVIGFANTLLENTKGGMVAGIGFAILFWTVIKVLGNIEKSFNDIWGIKEGRGLSRKFSDYLSIMLICPLLVIVSSGVTVFVATQITMLTNKFAVLGFFGPVIFTVLKLLPFLVIWLLFAFIYTFMPNTKVNIKSAVVAGIVSGTIYQFVQWGYINFQVGVAKYNAIYGSFAALPLFLVWLQISWLVVLLGAEISFVHQNVDTYEFEPDCLRVSYSFKKLLALRVMTVLVKNFISSKPATTAHDLVLQLEIPVRLLRQILHELMKAGMVAETLRDDKSKAFAPAVDVNKISLGYVVKRLEDHGVDDIPVLQDPDLGYLSKSLEKFSEDIDKDDMNILLKDI